MGYDVLTTINAGEGFWVNAKARFTAQLNAGTAITTASFSTMPTGWSLISVGDRPTAGEFDSAQSTTPPSPGTTAAKVITLWAWNSSSNKWYFYAPSLQALGGTALTDYITSKGYLDFATNKLESEIGFWVYKH